MPVAIITTIIIIIINNYRGTRQRCITHRPFDHLTMTIGGRVKEQPSLAIERGCSNILAASSNAFTLCDPVTLTFDLLI